MKTSKFHVISKPGNRKINEDSVQIFNNENILFAVLADGLGGHGYGDVASALTVKTAVETFQTNLFVSEESICQCFENCQSALLERQQSLKGNTCLRTTLCILMADRTRLIWGHVGDSRIYFFRREHLVCRTLDHSVPQILAIANKIREEDIAHHPDRNRLLRAMGEEWIKPAYTLSHAHSSKGKLAFLLCSDGFWEWINEREIISCLKNAVSPAGWLESMENIVLAKGAGSTMDNYSAICIWL